MSAERQDGASAARLVAAFAAVYVLWGSTYVAIKFAVETMPPFLMAGTRFVLAGLVMLAWSRARGEPPVTARQARNSAIAGALMLLCSNGLVCWAEQRVESALAALLVATVPLWMTILDWARPGGLRPSATTLAGVAVGLSGVAILTAPLGGAGALDPLGVTALLVATLCWSTGSIFTRAADMPRGMFTATALQMTLGGAFQFLAGLAIGELDDFAPEAVSARSVLSLGYLLVAGSLFGFTAYNYLLRHTTAARAATYAYVNPIVAVALGAWLADETIDARRAVGAAVVVLGVVLSLKGTSSSRAAPATGPSRPAARRAREAGPPRG